MADLKQHFNEVAENYDATIEKNLVNYNQMIEALINAIPDNESPRILDLGCGTGNITKKVLERFPNGKVTCFDLSEKMIEIAKEKLSDYDNIEYVMGDFTIIDIIDKYDAIISSLHYIIYQIIKQKKICINISMIHYMKEESSTMLML